MNSTILNLLGLISTLLLGIQQNLQASDAVKMQAVSLANQAVQLGAQVLAQENNSQAAQANVPQAANLNIWPNYDELQKASYLDEHGNRVPLGEGVSLVDEYISFGDLNNDGLDDAAVVVRRLANNGAPSLAIAAMLNQRGSLFNIADLPLGTDSITVYDHHVVGDEFVIDMNIGNGARTIYRYKLLGSTLVRM